MSHLRWFNEEEGIQRLREIGMSEQIYRLIDTQAHGKGTEDTPFTSTMRNKCVKGIQASLKSSVITFPYRPDLTVGTVPTFFWQVRVTIWPLYPGIQLLPSHLGFQFSDYNSH